MKKISDQVQKLLAKEQKTSKRTRNYSSNRSFPLPRAIPQKKDSQRQIITESNRCSINQNYPLFLFQNPKALRLRKFTNANMKKQLLVIQNIQRISHDMQKWIYQNLENRITGPSESIELYALLEKREERHFQLDRIIKYLST